MVDDDGLLVKVLTVLLEEQGHVVTSARDAMGAVLELGKPAAPDRTADGNRSVGSFGAKDELSRAARAPEATAKTWLNGELCWIWRRPIGHNGGPFNKYICLFFSTSGNIFVCLRPPSLWP